MGTVYHQLAGASISRACEKIYEGGCIYYAQAYIKLPLCGTYEVSCSLKNQPPISISSELAVAP
jgi:hypothetical protein